MQEEKKEEQPEEGAKFSESDSLRELLRKRLEERRKNGENTAASAAVDEVFAKLSQHNISTNQQDNFLSEKGGLLNIESDPLFKRVRKALFRYQKKIQSQSSELKI